METSKAQNWVFPLRADPTPNRPGLSEPSPLHSQCDGKNGVANPALLPVELGLDIRVGPRLKSLLQIVENCLQGLVACLDITVALSYLPKSLAPRCSPRGGKDNLLEVADVADKLIVEASHEVGKPHVGNSIVGREWYQHTFLVPLVP